MASSLAIEEASPFDPPWRMTGDGSLPRIGHPSFYRNFPQQARSRMSAAAILSAACTLSREAGTSHIDDVARRVGLSKAALYRFFTDDHALRMALASQELELYLDAMTDALHENSYARWQDVVLAHATIRCEAYRTRKGPALVSERYGPASNESEVIAEYLLGEITLRFADALIPADAVHRIEVAIRLIDAVIERALANDSTTMDSAVYESRVIADRYLTRPVSQRARPLPV
jgi:AcrR family transcriptional regulator